MTEPMKCKCGSERLKLEGGVGITSGEWSAQIVCIECGRRGPRKPLPQDAHDSWNVDRLAEEKAREALSEIVSWCRDTQTCANEDAMWSRAREALRLLEEA